MATMSDYEVIRRTAGVYVTGTSITEITGEQRSDLVSFLLAKRTEFAQPGNVVESLVLREDGSVAGHVAAFIEDDRILLIAEQSLDINIEEIGEKRGLSAFAVTDLSESLAVVAVEGPAAWKVVKDLANEDITGVLLSESCTATLALTSDVATIIRTGTTAEYGYLILASGVGREELLRYVAGIAHEFDGRIIEEAALQRAQAEVSHPLIPEQFTSLSVREAGALWMLSADREDEYLGSAEFSNGTPTQSLVAITAANTQVPVPGTAITAGTIEIGSIHLVLPQAGQPHGLALALLDAPFNVPGLELQADGIALKTISRPAVDPISWTEPIG